MLEEEKMAEFNHKTMKVEILSETKIKADLDTFLESVFFFGSVISGIALVVMLINVRDLGNQAMFYFAIAGGFLSAFITLYKCTDNFYLFDLERSMVFYHFKFFSFLKITPLISFDEIQTIAVDCARRQSKSRVWYEYAVILISRAGEKLRISDWHEYPLTVLEDYTDWLADRIGAEKLPGQEMMCIKLEKRPSGTDVVFCSTAPSSATFMLILVLVIFFALFVILFWSARS